MDEGIGRVPGIDERMREHIATVDSGCADTVLHSRDAFVESYHCAGVHHGHTGL